MPKFPPSRPPPPPQEDPSDEEEDEEEEEDDAGSSWDGDEGEQEYDAEKTAEMLGTIDSLLRNSQSSFVKTTGANKATADRVQAAVGVVATSIDPLLSSTSDFAKQYRSIAATHLKNLSENLFCKREAKAKADLKALSAEDIKEHGTGLMWTTVFGSVTEAVSAEVDLTEQDEAIFNHCVNVTYSYVNQDPFAGVEFTFIFTENPFFTNTELKVAFHYACGSLSLSPIGPDTPLIAGLSVSTPVKFKPGFKFQLLEKEVPTNLEAATKLQDALLARFFPKADSTQQKKIRQLMGQVPKSLFTALFACDTPAEVRKAVASACLDLPNGRDEAPKGLGRIVATTLGLDHWRKLASELLTAVRAPMITVADASEQNDGLDFGDDEDEEEEEGDEESNDGSEEDPDERPKSGKRNRAETAPKKPEECKQQ